MASKILTNKNLTVLDLSLSFLILIFISIFGILSNDKQSLTSINSDICGIYCKMATNFYGMIIDQSFDPYYLQKSFLSFLAHNILILLNLSKSTLVVNYLLEIISSVFFFLSGYLWFLIAKNNCFSRSAFWVGFIGMFSCQLFVKLVPYAQESPDTIAFFFGILSLYSLSCKKENWLFPILIIIQFVQPQLIIFLAPAYLFFYSNSQSIRPSNFFYRFLKFAQSYILKLKNLKLRGSFLIFIIYIIFYTIIAYVFPKIHSPMHGTNNSMEILFPFSIFLTSVLFTYIFYNIKIFDIVFITLEKMKEKNFWKNFLKLFLLLLLVKAFVFTFARGEIMSSTSTFIGSAWGFASFYYQSIEQPLKLIIAPIIFYGPIFILFLFYFSSLIKNLTHFRYSSTGIKCSIILFILLLPDTESRHFIAFVPYLTFFCLWKKSFNMFFVFIFSFLSILSSRFYANYSNHSSDYDPYLMTWGPWFTIDIYYNSLLIHFRE